MRRRTNTATAATIIPTVDPEELELGGASAVGGFIGETQLPVTGKTLLSFPQDNTACIYKRLSWVIK